MGDAAAKRALLTARIAKLKSSARASGCLVRTRSATFFQSVRQKCGRDRARPYFDDSRDSLLVSSRMRPGQLRLQHGTRRGLARSDATIGQTGASLLRLE